ncbi:hypothetical protein NEFER03_0597 [Nematocida sp. LUAm3]|nr:hypothetical protein NEFER03_0597 [Nematocida sp. LUAm3]KAI5178406.1 hypothetical protein NEFER01_1553 [Nematocida sp. LUAm1]
MYLQLLGYLSLVYGVSSTILCIDPATGMNITLGASQLAAQAETYMCFPSSYGAMAQGAMQQQQGTMQQGGSAMGGGMAQGSGMGSGMQQGGGMSGAMGGGSAMGAMSFSQEVCGQMVCTFQPNQSAGSAMGGGNGGMGGGGGAGGGGQEMGGAPQQPAEDSAYAPSAPEAQEQLPVQSAGDIALAASHASLMSVAQVEKIAQAAKVVQDLGEKEATRAKKLAKLALVATHAQQLETAQASQLLHTMQQQRAQQQAAVALQNAAIASQKAKYYQKLAAAVAPVQAPQRVSIPLQVQMPIQMQQPVQPVQMAVPVQIQQVPIQIQQPVQAPVMQMVQQPVQMVQMPRAHAPVQRVRPPPAEMRPSVRQIPQESLICYLEEDNGDALKKGEGAGMQFGIVSGGSSGSGDLLQECICPPVGIRSLFSGSDALGGSSLSGRTLYGMGPEGRVSKASGLISSSALQNASIEGNLGGNFEAICFEKIRNAQFSSNLPQIVASGALTQCLSTLGPEYSAIPQLTSVICYC